MQNRYTRVKICCISSKEEAKMAIAYGAHALGLVGQMPSGPGVISDACIFEINQSVPPPISTFLLTSETSANGIIAQYHRVNTSAIQLVDAVSFETYQQLKETIPSVKIVQVIHVLGNETIEQAISASEFVDALLLDSGNPNLTTKILGGTGKTHNWDISKKIREESKVPVFLAGGLHAENVKKAIDQVEPFGVDICSGVRSNGQLDERKLAAFFNAVYS